MTEEIVLTGMVISSAPAGEYDKRVVILTRERGKITAFAKGAKKPRSQFAAGTRPFSFGKFTLYEGKSAYNLISVSIDNYFEDVMSDMERIYYGFHFLELADYFGTENVEAAQMLLLLYQSLRALSHPSLDNRLIRRIVELKMFVIHGEYPGVFECMHCGRKEELDGFSIMYNGMLCRECRAEDKVQLSVSTIYTMQYVISSGVGKLFNFHVSEEVLKEFGMVMNRFMTVHTDRQFHSLKMLEM